MPAPDTVTEAIQRLEADGYGAAVHLLDDGALRFSGVVDPCPLVDAVVERMYRFEGDSDPGDEMVVFGLRDPSSEVRGTLVSAFGAAADPDMAAHLDYCASKLERP